MKNAPAIEPGQEVGISEKSPPDTALDPNRQRKTDPRAAILLRAAARYELVRIGMIDLDQAFDPQFVGAFLDATGICTCTRETIDNFDRIDRKFRQERLRRWRRSRP